MLIQIKLIICDDYVVRFVFHLIIIIIISLRLQQS